MIALTRTVAALLVAAPAALAVPAAAQEFEEETGPVILELEPTVEPRGGDIKVIRGSAVHPEPLPQVMASKALPPGGVEAIGGQRLWLVDRKAGHVTGCMLATTIRGGDMRQVRCTTERLP